MNADATNPNTVAVMNFQSVAKTPEIASKNIIGQRTMPQPPTARPALVDSQISQFSKLLSSICRRTLRSRPALPQRSFPRSESFAAQLADREPFIGFFICGLMFDMRGGRQPAKPDVARPLDGRVRPHLPAPFDLPVDRPFRDGDLTAFSFGRRGIGS